MSETTTVSREARQPCRRCGEPTGTFRFCLNCGADVSAEELAPVERPAAGAEPSALGRGLGRLRRWRTSLIVFPLLASLAIAAGMGAQMLMAEIPRPPKTEARVTCWNGQKTAEVADCSAPSGRDGLRWVFPSFHPNRERDNCVDVLVEHPEYQRPAMYTCDFKVMSRWVEVTYSQLADVDAGRRYFEKTFPRSDREKVRTAGGTPYRYVWRKPSDEGFELAAMYIDHPYAVTVVAPRAIFRDQALRDLTFRHPDKILSASGGSG